MKHYIDIKLNPDAEMRINVLLNKTYSKLHKALFTLKSTDIGVSFPRYKVLFGDIIRLHSSESRLKELQAMNWLGALSGYCSVSSIQKIPAEITHRNISRIQANMTEAKLRRLIKRGSISEEKAKVYKTKMFSQGLDNPYLELESTSNGHKHRRYINFSNITDSPHMGEFDDFGLSKTATVPWF